MRTFVTVNITKIYELLGTVSLPKQSRKKSIKKPTLDGTDPLTRTPDRTIPQTLTPKQDQPSETPETQMIIRDSETLIKFDVM